MATESNCLFTHASTSFKKLRVEHCSSDLHVTVLIRGSDLYFRENGIHLFYILAIVTDYTSDFEERYMVRNRIEVSRVFNLSYSKSPFKLTNAFSRTTIPAKRPGNSVKQIRQHFNLKQLKHAYLLSSRTWNNINSSSRLFVIIPIQFNPGKHKKALVYLFQVIESRWTESIKVNSVFNVSYANIGNSDAKHWSEVKYDDVLNFIRKLE